MLDVFKIGGDLRSPKKWFGETERADDLSEEIHYMTGERSSKKNNRVEEHKFGAHFHFRVLAQSSPSPRDLSLFAFSPLLSLDPLLPRSLIPFSAS